MLKSSLYRYGSQDGRVPAHVHFGKEIYDNMMKNKDIIGLINAETDERMTYGEMARMTASVALSLTRMGVRKGDVISLCSEKRFQVLPTIVGIICAGAAFSPMDITYGAHPLLHRLKICSPKVMFCSKSAYISHKKTFEECGTIQHYITYDDYEAEGLLKFRDFIQDDVDLELFDAVPVNGWQDNALIIYSSGTTGLPKGVPVTHLALSLNTQCFLPESAHGQPLLNTREWYYTYGLLYTLGCINNGVTVVFNAQEYVKDIIETVQKYKIMIIQVAPKSIMDLLKYSDLDKYDISSIQYIISSSTPIRSEAVDVIKKRLPEVREVIQMYGMSEGLCIATGLNAPLGSKPGSSGVPGPGYILKVVDFQSREPLGPNQQGEICIKGPSMMKGYCSTVSHTYKDSEGFYLSGDVGYYDDDGYFFITNRIKELIKYNDISIAPAEFEALLMQHPAVREAGVVGKAHPEHGEVPVAFVALQPAMSATEDELVEHVNSRITYRMRLAGGVRFVNELPLVGGAKLDRAELKRRLEQEDVTK